jgi:hypothetical protein
MNSQPRSRPETLSLRATLLRWADGKISTPEADALFDINNLGKSVDREWVDFFVEAITEYVVNGQEPHGYVDDTNADWLMARIDRDGRVESLGELELIVKILEKAINLPAALKEYALKQIESVVLTGEGPTRAGGDLRPNTVDESEVVLLRRIIFAQSGEGALIVSDGEADMLFRIKDATLGRDNAPGWQQLFVQGVGNHLMAHSDYTPLQRDEAIRLEAAMNDIKPNLARFFSRMSTRNFKGSLTEIFRSQDAVDPDAAIEADRAITPAESDWLKRRLDADAVLDPMELALLDFIAQESAQGQD